MSQKKTKRKKGVVWYIFWVLSFAASAVCIISALRPWYEISSIVANGRYSLVTMYDFVKNPQGLVSTSAQSAILNTVIIIGLVGCMANIIFQVIFMFMNFIGSRNRSIWGIFAMLFTAAMGLIVAGGYELNSSLDAALLGNLLTNGISLTAWPYYTTAAGCIGFVIMLVNDELDKRRFAKRRKNTALK